MKNKMIIITFTAMLVCAAVLFLLPADTESFKQENRAQSELPELSEANLMSGKFAEEFEGFVNDRISFRSAFTSASHFLTDNKGITPPDGKIVYTNKDIGTETVKKACMLIADGKMMEVFSKNSKSEKKYAEAINHIAENIDENINMYSLLVPTQLEFCDAVYRNIQTSQKKTIDEIYGMLDPRVICIDAYSSLKSHAGEYIYFKTDHHWTMLGSYYGYSAFMKAQNIAPVSLLNFEKHEIENFLGYLYEQYPDDSIKKNPDTIEWYDTEKNADLEIEMESIQADGSVIKYTSPMFDKTKTEYTFFFSVDHPYAHITNKKILNNKTLLIIKDSFASDFVPWCINNYRDIIMVDPRSYKGNLRDVFAENKIDDVLVINYIFTTSFEDYCDKMTAMFK